MDMFKWIIIQPTNMSIKRNSKGVPTYRLYKQTQICNLQSVAVTIILNNKNKIF